MRRRGAVKPSLLTQLRLEYKDGSSELVVSDETWKATVGPVVLDGIRQGETYDARREMPGWATASFDDSGWDQPEVVSGPKGKLRAQVTTPIKVTETLRPIKMTEPKPGIFVFDLGQNIAGWAQLQVSGPAGTTVKMIYGERLKEDGTVDQKEIKEHVYQDVFQIDTYILRGQGKEIWEPRFAYYGFQYVQIEGCPGMPTLESICGRVVNTAFDQTGQFSLFERISEQNSAWCAVVVSWQFSWISDGLSAPGKERLDGRCSSGGRSSDVQLGQWCRLYQMDAGFS